MRKPDQPWTWLADDPNSRRAAEAMSEGFGRIVETQTAARLRFRVEKGQGEKVNSEKQSSYVVVGVKPGQSEAVLFATRHVLPATSTQPWCAHMSTR